MAAQPKPRSIRLVDVLNTINEQEYVLLTFNNGRNTISHSAYMMQDIAKGFLTKEVKALTYGDGAIQIFI